MVVKRALVQKRDFYFGVSEKLRDIRVFLWRISRLGLSFDDS
jgi:hypothetical protein